MPSPMRTCTSCGLTAYPHDGFYRKPAHNGRKARWDSWCKQCRRELARSQYTDGAWVDALPTRALLTLLVERGRSLERIAEEVGCTVGTLRRVCGGGERVREVTARRVRGLADEMAMARSVE